LHKPTPAIVSQSAVRRLPRFALFSLCIAYVLAGFWGRSAWKTEDMATLGFIYDLAHGLVAWHTPSALGSNTDSLAFLPYWLGAIMLLPDWGINPDIAVRIPFVLLLALSMVATWYGSYYLARTPLAQPVAFAFGGEARPKDYARAMADGALLAFMACLGLAQLAHETTPALAQLGFSALYFYAIAALPYRSVSPMIAAIGGQIGLTLSGAPMLALALGLGSGLIHAWDQQQIKRETLGIVSLSLLAAWLAYALDLWSWKVIAPPSIAGELYDSMELLLWFTWPCWPLALWTVWIWRKQILTRHLSRHLAWPGFIVLLIIGATLATDSSDRTLLLALPALAALAAFALPTLKRQVAAAIDWFTLLFFTGCGIIIWVVWLAMVTGIPPQPALNVSRLAPGFHYVFSVSTLLVAIVASIAWAALVRWRVGRHRSVIWKSLALPAGGATLCWVLLMSLWLPLLDYTQGYRPLIQKVQEKIPSHDCIQIQQLPQDIRAALQWYGTYRIADTDCRWLLTRTDNPLALQDQINISPWLLVGSIHHPADRGKSFWIWQRH
jgi:hypothetical protein